MSKNHPSPKSYLVGFGLSIALTLLAFGLVSAGKLDYWPTLFIILGLAVIQLFVQLNYFLHLTQEAKPRWKLTTFISATIVVIIVVFGSIWIMDSLSRYHGHDVINEDIDEYIQDEEAIYKDSTEH